MFSSFFGNYISHLITISHRSHPGTDESMPARYSDGLGLRHIAKAEFTQDEDRQLYVIDSIKLKICIMEEKDIGFTKFYYEINLIKLERKNY